MTAVTSTPSQAVPTPTSGTERDEVRELLAKMRFGDRDAAALFVTRYGPLVRRRVRGKLGAAMRRIFDSTDILSTLSRRLDRYVDSRRLEAQTPEQLWALIYRMTDAALVDKTRLFARLRHTEAEDSDFAHAWAARLESVSTERDGGVEFEVEQAFRLFPDSPERDILSLWLTGLNHRQIADSLGPPAVSHDAVRQRWKSMRETMASSLLNGAAP